MDGNWGLIDSSSITQIELSKINYLNQVLIQESFYSWCFCETPYDVYHTHKMLTCKFANIFNLLQLSYY